MDVDDAWLRMPLVCVQLNAMVHLVASGCAVQG